MTPPEPEQPRPRRPFLVVFASHWLAMLGLGLVLTAIVGWACLLPTQLRHGAENPYIGLAMVAVAAVFVLGLVLTPLGLYLGRRRLAKGTAALPEGWAPWRRLLGFVAVTSVINLLIASQMTLRVVHAMESREFCGSCHVMTPESRAFVQGPHAGLLCVDCHVGDGALGLVKSKIQGTHQLWSVLADSVEVPIKTAIEADLMVPSAETCEDCHWKDQPAGASLKLIQRYAEDEANTPQTTLLTMNVGGERQGGIHGAHHGEGIEVRFVASDARRQEIPLVEYRNEDTGVTRTYVKDGVDAASLAGAPRITMQCFDCHNRAAHAFQMPGPAVDRALTLGRMPTDLPFIKRNAVAILTAEYESSEAAAEAIPAALVDRYRSEHADVAGARMAEIEAAGDVLADIYSRNVFPDLGVTWGTYPDNRGHQDAPGCFRCHAGEHRTAQGEELTSNCFRCHHPAAVGETKPEILELLGVDRLLEDLQEDGSGNR